MILMNYTIKFKHWENIRNAKNNSQVWLVSEDKLLLWGLCSWRSKVCKFAVQDLWISGTLFGENTGTQGRELDVANPIAQLDNIFKLKTSSFVAVAL